MLFVVPPVFAATSTTAAQIELTSVPPSTVELSIGDLPIVGPMLSGTYARVDPQAAALVENALGKGPKRASVVITSPSDKASALRELAAFGHLEFGTFEWDIVILRILNLYSLM